MLLQSHFGACFGALVIMLAVYTQIKSSGPLLSLSTLRETWYWWLVLLAVWTFVGAVWKEVYPRGACTVCNGKRRIEETVTERIE
jgi:hypothetical protein